MTGDACGGAAEQILPLLSGSPDTELTMGGKASNNFQSDRPESGGADKDMLREKSGLLERDKEKYAVEQQARQAEAKRELKDEANDAPDGESRPSVNPDNR